MSNQEVDKARGLQTAAETAIVGKKMPTPVDSGTNASILVVDDHPENLRTLSLILQAEGYKVRKASSGAMALETVQVLPPDLILLDIRMPQIDGFEVCTLLKRLPHTCQIPIVFISASDDVNDKVQAFEIGGVDYITKPFKSREVLARIQHQLTIQRQRQELATLYQQMQHLNLHLEQQVQERTQELQSALGKLQQLNQLKDDFLSTISHELRTPIANISAVLQLLMAVSQNGETFFQKLSDVEAVSSPGSKIAQYLNILKYECDRELDLVQDLLDLQYLGAGVQPLDATVINLYEWIPHVLEVFETPTRNQQQTLTTDLSANLPLLETDPSSLSRILSELLRNACKYTPIGGTITVVARAEADDNEVPDDTAAHVPPTTAHQSNPTIVISVANSGVAIPPEELPRVFDKFYRIPSSDPYKYAGTGLGLALVKKQVEYLQGTITVTSNNNLTCFTVKLPTHPRS